MKYASLLCLLCLVLLASTCKKSSKLQAELVGKTWLHSYEEDEDSVLVYRPNTFDFPPSRGRTGFSLDPNGVIRRYEIAPTDGLEEQFGQWKQLDDDRFQVQMNPGSNPPQHFVVEIVSIRDNVLKVKRVQPRQEEDR
ncbi:hypothetical protein CLV24_101280 [Pontibacter ummariensis]|uniref:Lipocalin-like domain-containing protein n=1 Tax=Pontibacter ummariensis TaxID=1610492 RepID=A0A239BDG0_9BACT|nr:hypothetical protein [Pontibacter ummariensis]PRY16434.1 hypothetical protein CLV24_101280 [Pontibacter ummariensis]SNS05083.1 hypothetical protein SAMN06296052_101280 [Pontibacter ummariensis]